MRHVEELFEWALKLVNIFETSYARQDVIFTRWGPKNWD